ncbi:Metal homeostatis protein BSD2 [Wickerhamiella sorbophila]|uniref:Metal homeostatis protein BSD2 n=1 Tax=Wickerhamiella sorbophila TaxID=45607 RepID=A0A2T0FD60_9ASCO|nr:Metal homeostatis protein BSD2 [Wickerhamiella sorbophila]PRT52942.1 Metal homeostatis protein BSD2 [Wickerhamiella sorbophila]
MTAYSQVPQAGPLANEPEESTGDGHRGSAERLINTFEFESESDEDWVDDRQTNIDSAAANTQTPSSSQNQEHSRGLSFNIFARFGKNKTESGHGNGVFGNLVAKGDDEDVQEDDGEVSRNEKPPSYEEAAADATPSYWETTIMTSDWSDEVLVGDMPVGGPMHFAWNMLVSSTFTFIGFVVTYLFHTTHAARGGSLAGLGCSLIQASYSFDISARAPSAPPDEFIPDDPNDFNGGSMSGSMHHPEMMSGVSEHSAAEDCNSQSTLVSNIMFIIGWVLIARGLHAYLYAQYIKTRILRHNTEQQQQQVPEELVLEPQPEQV